MAWEDKTLKKNAQNEIVPQAFNETIDDYEPVKSTDGALHNVLYGPNGLPIKDINNKLEVRSTELEALVQGLASEGKLEQARLLLESIDSKDMATNSTLEQARLLLASLDGKDFATDAELALVKSQLQTLETKLDSLATILTDGTQKVQQSGNIARLLRTTSSSLGIGNTVPRIYGMGPSVNQYGSVESIPIQNYERKIVVVTNDYDTAHSVMVYGTYENKVGFTNREYYHLVPSVDVPAKATRVFTSVEYPLLAEPFIGLFLWGKPSAPPTEGSLRIVVMGR